MKPTPSGTVLPSATPSVPQGAVSGEKRTPSIVALWPARDAGRLLALFDLEVAIGKETWLFRRCRLIQDANATLWISGPLESWKDLREGKTRYRALVVFPDRWREGILNLAIASWNEYQESGILPQARTIGGRSR